MATRRLPRHTPGTIPVAIFPSGCGYHQPCAIPRNVTAVGSRLFFVAEGNGYGREPWTSVIGLVYSKSRFRVDEPREPLVEEDTFRRGKGACILCQRCFEGHGVTGRIAAEGGPACADAAGGPVVIAAKSPRGWRPRVFGHRSHRLARAERGRHRPQRRESYPPRARRQHTGDQPRRPAAPARRASLAPRQLRDAAYPGAGSCTSACTVPGWLTRNRHAGPTLGAGLLRGLGWPRARACLRGRSRSHG